MLTLLLILACEDAATVTLDPRGRASDDGNPDDTSGDDTSADDTADDTAGNTACPPAEDDYDGDCFTVEEGDCDDRDPEVNPSVEDPNDYDGDCFTVDEGDCADYNAAINPDATDIDDGDNIDQNCDGLDGTDDDGDGIASEASGGEDCADEDAAVYPGALEVNGNGLDDDCNGLTDGLGFTVLWTPDARVVFALAVTDDPTVSSLWMYGSGAETEIYSIDEAAEDSRAWHTETGSGLNLSSADTVMEDDPTGVTYVLGSTYQVVLDDGNHEEDPWCVMWGPWADDIAEMGTLACTDITDIAAMDASGNWTWDGTY